MDKRGKTTKIIHSNCDSQINTGWKTFALLLHGINTGPLKFRGQFCLMTLPTPGREGKACRRQAYADHGGGSPDRSRSVPSGAAKRGLRSRSLRRRPTRLTRPTRQRLANSVCSQLAHNSESEKHRNPCSKQESDAAAASSSRPTATAVPPATRFAVRPCRVSNTSPPLEAESDQSLIAKGEVRHWSRQKDLTILAAVPHLTALARRTSKRCTGSVPSRF